MELQCNLVTPMTFQWTLVKPKEGGDPLGMS